MKATPNHLGIAEMGKVLSLKGDHEGALRYYRKAIHIATSQSLPEVFFQHYTHCAMESLEQLGAHDAVIEYCEKMETLLADRLDESAFIRKTYAAVLEKHAMQLLLKGEMEEGRECMEEAQQTLGRGALPLTDQVLDWMRRGYRLGDRQLKDARVKHNYFSVRAETVQPELAVELPDSAFAGDFQTL